MSNVTHAVANRKARMLANGCRIGKPFKIEDLLGKMKEYLVR